ncbi:hypothetical protein [Pantoea ananatis]|uniref:hypothetical protein n=1 Tax=Pantoea ananas TaxID=553 RepID=UPI00059EA176|nr:hypothetical protein [Pantoea ananatis]
MIYINANPGLLESASQKTATAMGFLKNSLFIKLKKIASQLIIFLTLLSVFFDLTIPARD